MRTPLWPGMRVRMLWQDEQDPSQGTWWQGVVVANSYNPQKGVGPAPGQSPWEATRVKWEGAENCECWAARLLILHAPGQQAATWVHSSRDVRD